MKISVEKVLQLTDIWEVNLTECTREKLELRDEINPLKMMNEEKIDRLKGEHKELKMRQEVEISILRSQ